MPSLRFLIGGDASPLEREWKRVERITGNLNRSVVRATSGTAQSLMGRLGGLIGLASLTQLSRSTVQWAGDLRDTADQIGINVELLQKLSGGAKLTGASMEDLSKFFGEMNKSREDALLNPSGKNAAAFGRMNIGQSDIAGLSPQAFFQKIVDAFKNGATAQLANDVQEVGGRSARNLIAAFSAQFASDTPILAEELVDQLDDLGDSFTELKTRLMVDLAPAIIWVVNQLGKIPKWARDAGTAMGAYGGSKGIVATAMDAARYNRLSAEAAKAESLGLTKPGDTKLGFFTQDARVPTVEEAAFMRDFEERMRIGSQVVAEDQAEVAAQDSAIAGGRASARAARRKRENAPPLFTSEKLAKEKADSHSKSGGYDPHLTANQKIGAFIGGPDIWNLNLDKKHLSVAEQTLQVLRAIEKNSAAGNQPLKIGGFRVR